MLAKTYLSAAELKCPQYVVDAAITLLGMLERGEFVAADGKGRVPYEIDYGLNMGVWHMERRQYTRPVVNFLGRLMKKEEVLYSCGTVGCIGGWIEHIAKRGAGTPVTDEDGSWADLFYPKGWDDDIPENFPIERCTRALRAKLTTGVADWSE